MAASCAGIGFREVSLSQKKQTRPKDITISVDRADGLIDYTIPDAAGGYSYIDSGRSGSSCRNRFIYWRTHKDCLELNEESLDFNLSGNRVRFHFTGSQLLGCIGIHERDEYVIVLAATVSSVHRLKFIHPNRLHKYDPTYLHSAEKNMPSIFADVSVFSTVDSNSSSAIKPTAMPGCQVTRAATFLTNDDEAIFALATNTSSVILIRMRPPGTQGPPDQFELRQTSIMQRLWTGFMSAVVRSGGDATICQDLTIQALGQDLFVLTISQDHKMRMWSVKTLECIMVDDMLKHVSHSGTKPLESGNGHRICKLTGSTSQSAQLAVYLSLDNLSQFCLLTPVWVQGHYELNCSMIIHAPEIPFISDCMLTSNYLWAMWESTDGEVMIRFVDIQRSDFGRVKWNSITQEVNLSQDSDIKHFHEPRDFYLRQIFKTSHFCTTSIIKALQIFGRSAESSSTFDVDVPFDILRLEVIAAVEHEIRRATSGYEINADEYSSLQQRQWFKFYSYCQQYHEVVSKPLGFISDPVTGMLATIKKTYISVMRPYSMAEYLTLTPPGTFDPACFLGRGIQDEEIFRDVSQLCECLKLIRCQITPEMESSFLQDIHHLQKPEDIVESLLVTIEFSEELMQCVRNLVSPTQASDVLFQFMDYTQQWPDGMFEDNIDAEAARQLSCGHLMSSDFAIQMLTQSVAQLARTGLDTSLDLLLFLVLFLKVGKDELTRGTADQIHVELIPKVIESIHAYYVIVWASETPVIVPTTHASEQNLQQLEILDISNAPADQFVQKFAGTNATLLELFVHGIGGLETRILLAKTSMFDQDPCYLWNDVLSTTIQILGQLMWLGQPSFPEYLAYQCQYLGLQEYCRLTQSRVINNAPSLKFLLGLSYLNTGEAMKARETFVKILRYLAEDGDDFMLRLLQTDESSEQQIKMEYLLKVIRLFEHFQLPTHVISLATRAIIEADDDDPTVPILWSKIFKHELEIGHNREAYTAMVTNPDPDRRCDCLRQLVVVLCERGELEQVIDFQYGEMEQEAVNILESRARSVDINTHNYYNLLYAFHVFRKNFRKAGSIMYEYSQRLNQEVPGKVGLLRQSSCLLAAMNALRLVNKKYAWIINPIPKQQTEQGEDMENHDRSMKTRYEGDERIRTLNRKVEVVELVTLQKEYLLVEARLKLANKEADTIAVVGPGSSVDEIVGFLVNAGFFDMAMNICRDFKIPYTQVIEGLAAKCVNLAKNSGDFTNGDASPMWDWLNENEVAVINAKEVSPADQAWALLQSYLVKFEDRSTKYHKCVAMKLLSHAFPLPSWFVVSYKKLNPAALLRLYLDFDLLEEATMLAIEYIDAVLGKGIDHFGLKTPLRFGEASVWLPHTCFDQLLSALLELKTESHYKQLFTNLQERLDRYMDTLEKISKDTIIASQTAEAEHRYDSHRHGISTFHHQSLSYNQQNLSFA